MNNKKLTTLCLLGLFVIPFSVYAAPAARLKINRPDTTVLQEPDWLAIDSAFFYDGDRDDLVTAGIGFTTLSSQAITPTFANPKEPTVQELRKAKLARYIDTQTGEGSLYGFRTKESTPLFDGKFAGSEIIAYTDDNDDVGMLLQIPLDFNKEKPCIVAVPSIDSDGLYNAKDVQIRGIWGLRHHCAVVYNDKGLGNGIYEIATGRGFTLTGTVDTDNLPFSPLINNRAAFSAKYPHRYAIKQLHSKQNPESKWGNYVLKSIDFAFYALNKQFSENEQTKINKNDSNKNNANKDSFNKDNTIVLVYGATDGGGAALKAGELDKNGVIDGIVAVNPQIYPTAPTQKKATLSIQYGTSGKTKLDTKSIADYSTYAALYIPCAVPAIMNAHPDTYVPYADYYIFSQNRCDALKSAKLLTTTKPEEALQKLHDYGWTPDMDIQLPYFYYKTSIGLPYQYISEYGRYDVTDNMCSYSVASTHANRLFNQGDIEPLSEVSFEQLWSKANGSLPLWRDNDATVLDLVNNQDANAPRREFFSTSKNSKYIDYNTQGAICLRDNLQKARVQKGLNEVSASGNLNGIKTFIVHGKNNVKQLPDYTSRAYVALNSIVEGKNSKLRYIEVDNSSYLDGLIPFDSQLLPIDYYGESAMDWLWSNLTKQTTLPESQVVHAKARGGKNGVVPATTTVNLVPIMQSPDRKNTIKKENGTLFLPKESR
ncbi:3-hydroxybutyrate oligomer hydrolase family protein [Orbaceae bacterium ESL0727]|nr:3-hydroxybutyrate oligomer hydrolase family protein [Orbaceae bacterium ESL0727]